MLNDGAALAARPHHLKLDALPRTGACLSKKNGEFTLRDHERILTEHPATSAARLVAKHVIRETVFGVTVFFELKLLEVDELPGALRNDNFILHEKMNLAPGD